MVYREKLIRTAPEAYSLLKGVICIHKPADWGVHRILHTLKLALCNDLNAMKQRPVGDRIEIVGSLKDEDLGIVRVPSLADNPLVVGPRYMEKDVACRIVSRPPYMSSGLCLVALTPNRITSELWRQRMVSTYHLTCELGALTDDGTTTGRIRERSGYQHVHQALIERYLTSLQSKFQRQAFEYAGVELDSQEAYELVSKGLVRPLSDASTIVYSLRCIAFDAPSFTLEVQVVNEDDAYLRTLVCDIARKLRTTAALARMRRVRFGPFTLDQALIKNHWTLENVLENIRETAVTMDQWLYPSLLGEADPSKKNLTLLKRIS